MVAGCTCTTALKSKVYLHEGEDIAGVMVVVEGRRYTAVNLAGAAMELMGAMVLAVAVSLSHCPKERTIASESFPWPSTSGSSTSLSTHFTDQHCQDFQATTFARLWIKLPATLWHAALCGVNEPLVHFGVKARPLRQKPASPLCQYHLMCT